MVNLSLPFLWTVKIPFLWTPKTPNLPQFPPKRLANVNIFQHITKKVGAI